MVAPKFAPDSPPARPSPEPAAIREQLERLLCHPLFANSKRYPVLLAYVVEQTLAGNGGDLKERSIGIEVFGREPSYDANADPVVRITAAEVRKRLTQYYYDPSHSGELVIELTVGTYQPTFRLPDPEPSADSVVEPEPVIAEAPAPEPVPVVMNVHPPRHSSLLMAGVITALVVLAAGAGLLGGLLYHRTPPPSLIERFWEPITSASGTATYCLGEPARNLDVGSINSLENVPSDTKQMPLYFRLHYSGNLALADVITLTRTAATLETRHKAFRVIPASEASFSELREGPIVLIGAFDNLWTLRVTQKLRFGFESKDGVALIVDRKSNRKTTWETAWDQPYEKLSRDYAIVARIHDVTTGQPVIIAAGISEEGTEAAGEILYNPQYLAALLEHAPANWEQKNMEAVIETQVIGGHSGPPNVLAVEFW